ncbi:hypothetical protein GSH19_06970 [Lactobacillus sp. S2-2]|uniref:hypothetical protein n=1 Tax=Lactobacillus sp. S2-2 TaxID=2692917 RepID=UPI001F294AAF|nr:hypothetical protein [Lactobacillus sp. S2-2]MCF6515884.1 hypothetical protein [Lactobacillus sp. S2-2]
MKSSDFYNQVNDVWINKNEDRMDYFNNRNAAKDFIRMSATLVDLDELNQLIRERQNQLSDDLKDFS